MKKRLKLYGIAILALSLYIIIGSEFAYSWLVGTVGLIIGVIFQIETAKAS